MVFEMLERDRERLRRMIFEAPKEVWEPGRGVRVRVVDREGVVLDEISLERYDLSIMGDREELGLWVYSAVGGAGG